MRRGCRERFSNHRLQTKESASYHVRDTRAVMHVVIANPRWRGKRFWHSWLMRNLQFYVSGKRPMVIIVMLFFLHNQFCTYSNVSWDLIKYVNLQHRVFLVTNYRRRKTATAQGSSSTILNKYFLGVFPTYNRATYKQPIRGYFQYVMHPLITLLNHRIRMQSDQSNFIQTQWYPRNL